MQNQTPENRPAQQPVQQPAEVKAPMHGPQQPPAGQHPHHGGKPRPKRCFFMRFMRGYLMIVGALVNIFVFSQLLLLLLEYLGNHFAI